MLLTVKQVAEKLNLSEYTIRFYTDQGLVPTVQRDHLNRRLFDQASLNWLQGCHYLRQSGLSVAKVKQYVDLCLQGSQTIPQRSALIQQQYLKTQEQLVETKRRLQYLEHKKEIYAQSLKNPQQDQLNPKTWA